MQVEWYRSFTEAAKSKSLSKAAEKLNLTQPAISKHIRQLEMTYDVELFRRSHSGVDLTDAGLYFLDKIIPVVQALEVIEAEMRQFSNETSYTLGSLPSVATHILPERLRGYHASGKTITVKIRETSIMLRNELQDGYLDAALMDAELLGGRLWSRELFTENYVTVLPEGHMFLGRNELSVIELKDEPFVFTTNCDSLASFRQIAENNGFIPNIKMETDNNDFLLNIVAVGTGITILPEMFRAKAEQLGLHTVPVVEPEMRRTIVLAARTMEIGSKLYKLLGAADGPSI